MNRILMIEDDQDLATLVTESLKPHAMHVDLCETAKEATQFLTNQSYSLVLVDLNLPDGSGINLIETVQNSELNRHTPVLIMTAENTVEQKISAFSKGVDDYIVKPFNILELKARMERRMAKQNEFERLEAGPLTLDLQTQSVRLLGVKTPVYLTPREFKILHLLAKNPKQTYSREMILKRIWGDGIHVTNRTVDAHICYLRKKLDRYCHLIRSSAGEGYRFQS